MTDIFFKHIFHKNDFLMPSRICSYATHIFDGLDDWPTHLHYLNNTGATGWQGEIGDLEMYRDMRARGEPSPLLRIAGMCYFNKIINYTYLSSLVFSVILTNSLDLVLFTLFLENWLRAELQLQRTQNITEEASGSAAFAEKDPLQQPNARGGGFSAGRFGAYASTGFV